MPHFPPRETFYRQPLSAEPNQKMSANPDVHTTRAPELLNRRFVPDNLFLSSSGSACPALAFTPVCATCVRIDDDGIPLGWPWSFRQKHFFRTSSRGAFFKFTNCTFGTLRRWWCTMALVGGGHSGAKFFALVPGNSMHPPT